MSQLLWYFYDKCLTIQALFHKQVLPLNCIAQQIIIEQFYRRNTDGVSKYKIKNNSFRGC